MFWTAELLGNLETYAMSQWSPVRPWVRMCFAVMTPKETERCTQMRGGWLGDIRLGGDGRGGGDGDEMGLKMGTKVGIKTKR